MRSPITVHIEMPKFLKKYLIANSENKEESLIFSRKHDYNILLIRLVTNYRTSDVDFSKTTVKIKLPFNDIKDVYFYNNLSYESRKIFREQVKRDFYYDFKVFIKEARLYDVPRKKALELFCNQYNINEDDIKFESLYRNFTRHMNKRKTNAYKLEKTQLNKKNIHYLSA